MIPKFLAAEVIPYASVEIIPAPSTGPFSVFALFIENPKTGYTTVMTFPSRFDRALHMITLSSQPLVLKTADY
jgi:hypothetical protein